MSAVPGQADTMNPASVDDVGDALREQVDSHIDAHPVTTHVTGRAGEFYLTVDNHHYLVTIEPAEETT